jgi:hypothetical protein
LRSIARWDRIGASVSRRQRIALRIAAWACLVTAAAHTAGHFAGPRTPESDEEATLLRLMTEHQMPIMGMQRTLGDFLNGFSWIYTLLHVTLAALAFLVLRSRENAGLLDQAVARLSALVALLLLVIAVRYFVLPPIVCGAVVFAAFAVAAFPPRTGAGG